MVRSARLSRLVNKVCGNTIKKRQMAEEQPHDELSPTEPPPEEYDIDPADYTRTAARNIETMHRMLNPALEDTRATAIVEEAGEENEIDLLKALREQIRINRLATITRTTPVQNQAFQDFTQARGVLARRRRELNQIQETRVRRRLVNNAVTTLNHRGQFFPRIRRLLDNAARVRARFLPRAA